MHMLLTVLHCAYLVRYSYQINFPGWWVAGWLAGLTEIKANSASQQSWSWGSAELGKNVLNCQTKSFQMDSRLQYGLSVRLVVDWWVPGDFYV